MIEDSVEFERTALPLMRAAVSRTVNIGDLTRSKMRLDSWRDTFIDGMSYQLSTYLVGNKVHERVCENIEYPSDWKESFKERWFPEFLKKSYPVKYTRVPTLIHHYHMCPHAPSPWNNGKHIEFLTTFDKDYDGSKQKDTQKLDSKNGGKIDGNKR